MEIPDDVRRRLERVRQPTQEADAPEDDVKSRLERLTGNVRVNLPEREPSLTEGPYPGPSTPDPGKIVEMDFLQRAPLEVGLPAVTGAVGGALGGVPGAMLGSGAGQLAGSELNRRVVAPALGMAPPQPSFSAEPGREAALQFGTGLAAEAIPGVAKSAGRRLLLGPATRSAPETMQAFKALDVEPKVTDIAAGRGVGMMESALRQTIPGSRVITPKMVRQHERLGTAARTEFLDKLGPDIAYSDVASGGLVQNAIKENVERLRGVEDQMWADVGKASPGTTITPVGFVNWANEVIDRSRRGLAAAQNGKTVELARNILRQSTVKDQDGNTQMRSIPFRQADIWRKDIGQVMDKPELISGFDQGRLRNLYSQAMDDIETGIQYTGSQDLWDSLKNVRLFGAQIRERYKDGEVAKVLDLSPEQIVARLQSSKGETAITEWKDAILGTVDVPGVNVAQRPQDLEAWNTARRHIFESVLGETSRPGTAIRTDVRGLPVETKVISGAKLNTELAKIGEEKLKVLLDPAERQMLKNVERVSSAIDRGIRTGAAPMTSITAQNAMIQGVLTSGAAGAGALIGGPTGGIVGAFAGSVLAPHMLAKLITNPKAVEIMASKGFAKLAGEFKTGHLSREGMGLVIRLLSPEFIGQTEEGSP